MNYVIRDEKAIKEFCNAHSISFENVFCVIIHKDGSFSINGNRPVHQLKKIDKYLD